MRIDPDKIHSILVVRNDRFGEFLLNIPALRALHDTFRKAKIILVVSPAVQELAGAVAFADEIISWGQEKHSFAKKQGLMRVLKSKRIDMAVMLNPSKEFNIISWRLGIPIRVGYNRKWGILLNRKIKDEKHLGQKHEVEYNLDVVGLVNAKTDNFNLTLFIDEKAASGLVEAPTLQKAIVIHPWTSDPRKQWPADNFLKLAKLIRLDLDLPVIIVGGREESVKNKDAFKGLGDKVIDLTGKTSLLQLAAILKKSRALVSCDSGPMHLAAAVNTPVIALFRNDLPGKTAQRWGPWGSGYMLIEKPNLSISVEEVFEKVKEVLKSR